ncbi:MAG: cation-translocating P-type ATPase [Burkholderiales bacterium]|nr:cation-translocating P-type ATPase [Burkholderiales bacterium]
MADIQAFGSNPAPVEGVGGWLLGQHRGPLTVTDDFSVLDDPVEQQDFTQDCEVQGRAAYESVLLVQGMYCAACSDAVESAIAGKPGVLSAQVHAATRRLIVRWDPALVRISELARAVGAAGYRLLPLQQALSVSERQAETRKALWRLFVAGFCMMQVMMYTTPMYVTQPGEIAPDLLHLLRWACWILSVPVLLFASGPFFGNAWRDLRRGRVGMDTPVSIGILVTFIASSGATFDPTGPWGSEIWYDSLTMFVFFLLGGRYLELKARDRTAGALDALINRLPERCERQQADGAFESISLKRLQPGDVVRVQAGQAFPGDGLLLSAGATVDEALLTGESHPVTRRQGEALVAGSYNLAGAALMRIERLGRDTRFAQIVQLMERASTEKPRLAQLADRIAAPFLLAVLLAAALSGWWWWQIDPDQAIAVAVAVLIVTCPCALSLATPVAMLAAAGALAKRGVLVRRLQAFEVLAGIDTVVFDKTGTLTRDRLVLSQVLVRPGLVPAQALQQAASLASASLHPVSRAIARAAQEQGLALPAFSEVQELPGLGLQAGQGDSLLKLGSARFCGLDEAGLLGAGQSVEGQPCSYLVDASGWLATFVLDEGVREEAAAVVAQLHALGLETRLLSGDQAQAAERVARQLGITQVVAQASPERKLAEVLALQQQGHRLAMVGDGLNDGPVLARADSSFALGHGAPLAQAQSDFVVQSGQLDELVAAILLARKTLVVVRQNLLWAAVYNLVAVPLALAGWMPPWLAGLGMAASSLLVIGNALRLARPPQSRLV